MRVAGWGGAWVGMAIRRPRRLEVPSCATDMVILCVYGDRERARERRHARNFMSPGSFGIVI